MDQLTASKWSQFVVAAFEELCQTALFSDCAVGSPQAQVPDAAVGATISIEAGAGQCVLYLISDQEGCRALAGGLMGMEPEEAAELEESEVADGVGEICNVWAGLVKGRMLEQFPQTQIGLPASLEGAVALADADTVATRVRVGEIAEAIVVAAPVDKS